MIEEVKNQIKENYKLFSKCKNTFYKLYDIYEYNGHRIMRDESIRHFKSLNDQWFDPDHYEGIFKKPLNDLQEYLKLRKENEKEKYLEYKFMLKDIYDNLKNEVELHKEYNRFINKQRGVKRFNQLLRERERQALVA